MFAGPLSSLAEGSIPASGAGAGGTANLLDSEPSSHFLGLCVFVTTSGFAESHPWCGHVWGPHLQPSILMCLSAGT